MTVVNEPHHQSQESESASSEVSFLLFSPAFEAYVSLFLSSDIRHMFGLLWYEP